MSRVKMPLTTKVRLSQQRQKNQFLPCTLLNDIKECKRYIYGSCPERTYNFAGGQNTSQPENNSIDNQVDVTSFRKTPYSSIKPTLENSDPGSIHLPTFSVSTPRVLPGPEGKNMYTLMCAHTHTHTVPTLRR